MKLNVKKIRNTRANRLQCSRWNLHPALVNSQSTFCWWEHPPDGLFKLSTDGSARETEGGIGGLIRDSHGHVIAAFSGTMAASDILILNFRL